MFVFLTLSLICILNIIKSASKMQDKILKYTGQKRGKTFCNLWNSSSTFAWAVYKNYMKHIIDRAYQLLLNKEQEDNFLQAVNLNQKMLKIYLQLICKSCNQGGNLFVQSYFLLTIPLGRRKKLAVMKVLESGNLSQFLGAWHKDFMVDQLFSNLKKIGPKHSIPNSLLLLILTHLAYLQLLVLAELSLVMR